MTLTATTDSPEATAGLAGSASPVSGRQAERLQAQIAAAQIKQQERDAEERRRQDRLDAEERRRQDRLAADEEHRQQRVKARDERRVSRRAAREGKLSALGGRLAEHSTSLMTAPLIVVPGWLGWDAMSEFGAALYGAPGNALPVLSEAGMWLFDFAIIRARRNDPGAVVWPLYVGMALFAGICAALNFMHGLLGPIPGSIPPGAAAGLAYALISVSGIIAHQIVEFGVRKRKAAGAEMAPLAQNVAPARRGATSAPVAPARGAITTTVVPDSGPVAGGAIITAPGRPVAALERGDRASAARPGNPAIDAGGDPDDDAETPAKRGEIQDIMRAYWEKEIAAGKIPNGADLNRAAGKNPKYSLGKKRAAEWRTQLPADFAGEITGDQQEAPAQEEPTSADQAGQAR